MVLLSGLAAGCAISGASVAARQTIGDASPWPHLGLEPERRTADSREITATPEIAALD
jgi:hypothetical protein